jgi:hypothetical protein
VGLLSDMTNFHHGDNSTSPAQLNINLDHKIPFTINDYFLLHWLCSMFDSGTVECLEIMGVRRGHSL